MEEEKFVCKSCSQEPTDSVNIRRVIEKLDAFFEKNDLQGAGEHLAFWAKEARALNDNCGLLSILNETLGYSRRTGNKDLALRTADEVDALLKENKINNKLSGATVFVNLGTTLKHFGEAERGLPFFAEAERIYEKYCMDESYESAALLNNRAASYCDLKRFDLATHSYERALQILQGLDDTLCEQAETYANMAELYAHLHNEDIKTVDAYLDKCWNCLTDENLPHDGKYAFTLTKCAPAFAHLGRDTEAEVLTDIAKEIYGK